MKKIFDESEKIICLHSRNHQWHLCVAPFSAKPQVKNGKFVLRGYAECQLKVCVQMFLTRPGQKERVASEENEGKCTQKEGGKE